MTRPVLHAMATVLEGWARELVTVASLYVIGAYFQLARYALPQADDFDYAVFYQRYGFWDAQVKWYHGWNGRYTFNAATTAVMGWLDPVRDYWLITFGILLVMFAAVFYVMRALVAGSWLDALRPSLLVTGLLLLGSPSHNDGYYWATGATLYPLANATLAVLCVPLVRLFTDDAHRWRRFAAIAVLAAVTIGCNETSMLLLDALIGGACAMALLKKRSILLQLVPILILCVALSYFVSKAPGNDVRGSFMPHKPDFDLSVKATTDQARKVLIAWMKDPLLVAATALAWPAAGRVFAKRQVLWLAVIPPLAVFVVWLSIFPSWYAKGSGAVERTLNVSYAVFLAGWFASAAALASVVRARITIDEVLPRAAAVVTRLAVVAAMLLHVSLESALKDLRTDCKPYHAELMTRYRALRAAASRGERDVMVAPIVHHPVNLYVLDLADCSDGWPNASYGEFFGVRSVRYVGVPPMQCPMPPKARTVVNPYSVYLFRPHE